MSYEGKYSNYRGRGHRKTSLYRPDVGINREFIAWDGEGIAVDMPMIERAYRSFGIPDYSILPDGGYGDAIDYVPLAQPYVLLANSKGDRLIREEGLSTRQCLEFILAVKRQHPHSIFVGFGFNYDVNQILKDLSLRARQTLHDEGRVQVSNYRIKWLPGKQLTVSHQCEGKRRSATIYDTFGFFQSSFLKACTEYLGEDDPGLALIKQGKEARAVFSFAEMEEFIIPYNNTELDMLVRVMNILRQDLADVKVNPAYWYGPGAVANVVLNKYKVPISRDIPQEVLNASQYAYAGGRFEQFQVGRHPNTVWQYDIRSAYPAAASKLPDLCQGTWQYVTSYEPGTFGIWRVDYNGGESHNPQPLFCRSESGLVSFPTEVRGWYWSPEADLVPDSVKEGWIFRPSSDHRPFAFVEKLYEQRRLLKSQGSSAQRALKLILNSLYGKLAQTIGDDSGPPKWHQLEYAGYITSYTRASIYSTIQQNPDAIIASETDAVFSTAPLELPLSPNLGDWEETEYNEIVYLQSGIYYAEKTDGTILCKYRGLDTDRNTGQPEGLSHRTVLDHLRHHTGYADRRVPPLRSVQTRFIGLGLALHPGTKAVWRSWEKGPRDVSIDGRGSGKRFHLTHACPVCAVGVSMYHCLHPQFIGGYSGDSYARILPWNKPDPDEPVTLQMDTSFMEYANDMARWQ